MANKDKKAAKAAAKANLAEKKTTAPVVSKETEKTPPVAPEAPVEAPTPPPVETPVEAPAAPAEKAPAVPETKKEEAPAAPAPAPQVEKPAEVKKPEVKTPDKPAAKKEEIKKPAPKAPAIPTKKVEEIKKPEEDAAAPIAPVYSRLHEASGKTRFSHADALKLGEMFKEEFVTNPNATEEQKQFGQSQYQAMVATEMFFYVAQISADFQSAGILVNPKQFVALEAQVRDLYGITLKGLPFEGNSQQLLIKFEDGDIPAQVMEEAKAAVKARAEVPEIPEPNTAMEDVEKMKVISAIAAQKNGPGNNLYNVLEWSRKAFGLTDASPAQTLAFLFDKYKGNDPSLLSSLTNAMNGKLFSENAITSPHALLKGWASKFDDKVVADLVKVFISRATEKRVYEHNLRMPDKQVDITNEFVLMARRIKMSLTPDVAAGILAKNVETPAKDEEGKTEKFINGDKCFKSLVGAYGDSESIIKEKITEIVGYYTKPLGRLSTYIDKSAYAD